MPCWFSGSKMTLSNCAYGQQYVSKSLSEKLMYVFSSHDWQDVSNIEDFSGRDSKSHHIHSYDQQGVSNISHFMKGSLIISFPMTLNSEWVTLHILSSHLLLCPIASECHGTFCERLSHYIFSHDQQFVSDTATHFENESLIHFWYDQQRVSNIAHLCEIQSHRIFFYDQQRVSDITHLCERQSHHIFSYGQQQVSDISYLWKAVSTHLFL